MQFPIHSRSSYPLPPNGEQHFDGAGKQLGTLANPTHPPYFGEAVVTKVRQPPLPEIPSDELRLLEPLPKPKRHLSKDQRAAWERLIQEHTQEQDVTDVKQPDYPDGLPKTTVIRLPENYQPVVDKTHKNLALNLPTTYEIETLAVTEKPLFLHIPFVSEPPDDAHWHNDAAWLDPKNDDDAADLLASGKQPSIISKKWEARWANDRLARDILQNFYDGQGGTLEGVTIHVSRTEDKRYKVRIEGNAQFDYEKAYLLGGTSKADDAKQAGEFGEGLKVMSLNLLRDQGAQTVKIGSTNWVMTYTMPTPSSNGNGYKQANPKMRRLLELAKKPTQGNFVEFDTTSANLIAKLFKALNYYVYPYNPGCNTPTIENEAGGIQLHSNRNGSIYVNGQRYSVEINSQDGNYCEEVWDDPLVGLSLWVNEDTLKKGRDRPAIWVYQINQITQTILDKATNEELVYLLRALKPFWKPPKKDEKNPLKYYHFNHLISHIIDEMKSRNLSTPFNARGYAGDEKQLSGTTLRDMDDRGCIIYPFEFTSIGMAAAQDFYLYANAINITTPTPAERRRIQLLKATVAKLIPLLNQLPNHKNNLEGPLLKRSDLDKPVYVFELTGREHPNDSAAGFARMGHNDIWLSRKCLGGSLTTALKTYLHELLHQHGADDSHEFSVAYENIIEKLLTLLTATPQAMQILAEADLLWNSKA